MKVKFWGVRGSIPTPGKNTIKYGGNTSCVSVEGSKGEILIFDGGSGLRELGIDLMKTRQFGKEGINKLQINMFFSHVHWDHIQGVPFFKPLFIPTNTIKMFGEKKVRTCLEETLKGQQQYPNFPISIEEICINGARLHYTDLYAGQSFPIEVHFNVSCTKLSHPDGVFCYRVDEVTTGKSFVYATDTEHRDVLDPRLLKIAKNADLLVYDAQYTPKEYKGEGSMPKFDWGHSTYEFAVDTAVEANVAKLVLFHHEPEHTDEDIDNILNAAKVYAGSNMDDDDIFAAFEGLEIDLQ